MLQTSIKWIFAGPRNELETRKRKRYIDQTANNITQLIYQVTKSDSRLWYKLTSDSNKTFYNTKETLFFVGLGLLIHKKTRSKDIVNILANLNLSIDYENVFRIETDITNAVVQRALKNNGVYVPLSIPVGLPVYFAVDNCDFKNDIADGKNEFHGTAQIVYQQSSAVLSPKSYKSIATKVDLSIMIHFQLVKFVQSRNQKRKSTLSLPPKIKTLICIENRIVSGFWRKYLSVKIQQT